MNMTQNPTSVNVAEKPKYKIIRVNKLALVIIVCVLAVVFIVAFASITPAENSGTEQFDNTHDTVINDNDREWYQKKSNALPARTVSRQHVAPDGVVKDMSLDKSEDKLSDLDKIKRQAYLEALDSPLAPTGSGLSESQPSNPLQINDNNGMNSPDSSMRKLPLSDEQIAKLADKFGDQNMQSEKRHFLENYVKSKDKDYLNEAVKKPISPFEIQMGTKIPAVLEGGINSDLPGQVTAIVRQNVYDTVTGKYLLIPQGSKLIIIYDSNIAFGQERVLPAVKRILMPNGESINLEGMPAADEAGYAGFTDQVNNHYLKIFGSAAVLAGLSAAFQLSQPQQSSALTNPTSAQIAAGAMGQQMSQVGTMLMSKNINVQPTLEIRPGYEFIVNVTADIVFPKPYR